MGLLLPLIFLLLSLSGRLLRENTSEASQQHKIYPYFTDSATVRCCIVPQAVTDGLSQLQEKKQGVHWGPETAQEPGNDEGKRKGCLIFLLGVADLRPRPVLLLSWPFTTARVTKWTLLLDLLT